MAEKRRYRYIFQAIWPLLVQSKEDPTIWWLLLASQKQSLLSMQIILTSSHHITKDSSLLEEVYTLAKVLVCTEERSWLIVAHLIDHRHQVSRVYDTRRNNQIDKCPAATAWSKESGRVRKKLQAKGVSYRQSSSSSMFSHESWERIRYHQSPGNRRHPQLVVFQSLSRKDWSPPVHKEWSARILICPMAMISGHPRRIHEEGSIRPRLQVRCGITVNSKISLFHSPRQNQEFDDACGIILQRIDNSE